MSEWKHCGVTLLPPRTWLSAIVGVLILSGCGQSTSPRAEEVSTTPSADPRYALVALPSTPPENAGVQVINTFGTGPGSLPIDLSYPDPHLGNGVHTFTLRVKCSGRVPLVLRDRAGNKVFGVMPTQAIKDCSHAVLYGATIKTSLLDQWVQIDAIASTDWALQIWVK